MSADLEWGSSTGLGVFHGRDQLAGRTRTWGYGLSGSVRRDSGRHGPACSGAAYALGHGLGVGEGGCSEYRRQRVICIGVGIEVHFQGHKEFWGCCGLHKRAVGGVPTTALEGAFHV